MMRSGRAHQAAADGQHLLLAARQRPGRLACRSASSGNMASTRSLFFGPPRARPRQHRADVEILRDRQGWKNLAALGDLADAQIADAMARPAGDVGAAKLDPARTRRCMPAIALISELLPAPLAPTMATISPARSRATHR